MLGIPYAEVLRRRFRRSGLSPHRARQEALWWGDSAGVTVDYATGRIIFTRYRIAYRKIYEKNLHL